jgi:hypothetical protein
MFLSKLNAGLLAIALIAGVGAAQATTITFDEFPASDTDYLSAGASFSTNGYNFDVLEGWVYFLSSGNGTTSMDLGGRVSVRTASNKPFSLTSFDLRTVLPLETSTVRLSAMDTGGNHIVETYTISGANSPNPLDLTTFNPTRFNNLTTLEMELVYGGWDEDTYFSLVDNMVLNEQAVSAVPEPGIWAMMGLGLAMVAGLSRRKRA